MYPASVEYMNRQWIFPILRPQTLGATVDLGFAVCDRLVSDFYVYLSIVFRTCYHWWICYWFGCSLLYFFLFITYLNYNIFLFFILIPLFYFFLVSFFSPFSSEPCGWQGFSALAGCQAWASEVGEPSSGHWTTRDLLASRNINQWELSQRSPSQC